MTSTINGIVNALGIADTSDVAFFALLACFALFLHLASLRFAGRGAAGAFSVAKWLCALAALRVLDERILRGFLASPAVLAYCLLGWFAFRAFLHDIYADIYLARIKGRQPNKLLLSLFSFLGAVVLVGTGLRMVLKVDVSSLLTSSAILTAVIGFSMQDTIGSLFSGLLIQTEKPFKIGDWIKVGDNEGQVVEISWRYTKLATVARALVLIPNNAIAKERVVNLCEPIPEVSVSVSVPTPVTTAPVKVKSAIEDVLRKSGLVCDDPPPRIRLAEVGADHITYRVFFYVRDYEDSFPAKSEVLSALWYEFKKQGIDFPPQRLTLTRDTGKACPATKEMKKLLAGIGLFEGMREDELELLVECAGVRTFAPQATIMERGQGGTTMFIIVSGSVSVRLDGRELSRLGPGDVFGEMALLTGEPRQADVVAVEPVSCLEVDREAFRGVLDKAPILVANVTRVFMEREATMKAAAGGAAPRESADGLFERFRKIFW